MSAETKGVWLIATILLDDDCVNSAPVLQRNSFWIAVKEGRGSILRSVCVTFADLDGDAEALGRQHVRFEAD